MSEKSKREDDLEEMLASIEEEDLEGGVATAMEVFGKPDSNQPKQIVSNSSSLSSSKTRGD